MVRNKVQFQKGVSLNDFIKQYGTEAQCFDVLYAWRWTKGSSVRPVVTTSAAS